MDYKETLNELEKIWSKHQELTLGKFILNAIGDNGFYFSPNSDLIKMLNIYYKE